MNPHAAAPILLMHQQDADMSALQSSLDELGASVVCARSHAQALEQAAMNRFAVMVLDMRGDESAAAVLELARQLRAGASQATTPIVFLTNADPTASALEAIYGLGYADYVSEPVQPVVLHARVGTFLAMNRTAQALATRQSANNASAAISAKDERIRLILDNARGYAFILTDVDGMVIEWEGSAESITGWAAQDIIGRSLQVMFTPEDRAAGIPQSEFQKALHHGSAEDRRWHMHKQGTRFFADGVMVPLKDEQGQVQGFAKMFRDATVEREASDEVQAGALRLQQSQQMFSLLLESSIEGIYGISTNGLCTFINAAGAEMLGYQVNELVGQPLLDIICRPRTGGAAAVQGQAHISRAVHDGIAARVDSDVFWHKSGKAVPVSYSVSPVLSGGRSAGAMVTFSDITERQSRELERDRLFRQVQVANDRLADVFKQAPAFICVLRGPEHVFELTNDRYLQLVGNRDLIGKPAREALPEVDEQRFFEPLDRVYQTGVSFTGVNMPVVLKRLDGGQPDGRIIDVVYMALRDADGSVTGTLVHGVDQTERAQAEIARRNSEERYRTLFETMDQGFCIIEVLFDDAGRAFDYRFIELNGMFERHAGLVDAQGKTMLEMAPDTDAFWFGVYGQVVLTDEPVQLEAEFKALDRWFSVHATRIGDPSANRVAVLFSDITGRKLAEQNLRQLAHDLAEADRRKTEFLATLAHELRNPLAPIRSGLGVLRLSSNQPATVNKICDVLDRQVGHMVHLIDDLLDVARISGGKIELKRRLVTLRSVVTSAIETSMPLIEAGRHELKVAMPDATLMLDADPVRLSQVLSNLLNNAAKYTTTGGLIEFSARQDGLEVIITVKDNGVGIPADSLDSVFDMFSQVGRNLNRAQGGLGIGLTLVRRLVEKHGGKVAVESAGEGQGSCFTVRLPLVEQGAHGKSPAGVLPVGSSQSASRKAQLKVLVVDDNIDAAETLAALLEIKGHVVRLAHDGRAALEVAAEFEPQLAFLDIGMPVMNGYDTARAMRHEPLLASTVLVALTGWGDQNDRAKSRQAGFDHHLTKPAELDAVDKLLTLVSASATI